MIFKFAMALLVIAAGWLLWRGPGKHRSPGTPIPAKPSEPPEVAEARRVLCIGAGASEAEIRAAYRRLAAAVHPDRGGSIERARQVNAARDILIKPQPGHGTDPAA